MIFFARLIDALRRFSMQVALSSSAAWPVRLWLLNVGLWLDSGKWIGSLWRRPNSAALVAQAIGSRHQLNHLGNMYALPAKTLNASQQIEKQVLENLKQQIAAPDSIEGYCTSGGTEATIFLLWLARNKMRSQSGQQPVVITTAFTHYSVTKAADILSLDVVSVATNPVDYTLSVEALTLVLDKLARSKQTSLAICLTLGYSSTGGCDNITAILKLLGRWQKKYKAQVFAWIDAAGQGLPLLFLDSHTPPFKSPIIQGYILDYHKLGTTPLPSGVVLYRNSLRKYIEQPIDYLVETDATLLGSRPGSSALAIWGWIISTSQSNLRNQYLQLLRRKNEYLTQLLRQFPKATIITHPSTLAAAVVVNHEFPRLSKAIESKFSLHYHTISAQTYSPDTSTFTFTKIGHYTLHFLYDPMPKIW